MTKPIPEGYHTITPSLNLDNTQEAIDLYKKAFNARELGTMKDPQGSGKIMHSVLEIGDSKIFLADKVCMGVDTESSNSTFYLYVPNVDNSFKQAKDAGLKELFALSDMFWGDRTGCVQDKFGITWTLATNVRMVSDDELKKGAEEFAKNMGKKAA